MTEITEIAVCFLIGLAAAVISALVFRWAMHDFCYSSFRRLQLCSPAETCLLARL